MHTLPKWSPSWLPLFVRHHKCVRSGLLDYDDVVNDTLLKLWQRRQRGQTLVTRTLIHWMIISLARKAYARRIHQMEPLEEISQFCGLEQCIHAREVLQRLEYVLDGFAPCVRTLIQLVASGCTVRDASLQLGLAPTTGHRWYHRVRAQIEPLNDPSVIF